MTFKPLFKIVADTKEDANRIEKLEKLLRHCKMFILEGVGYNSSRQEEIQDIREEFKEVGI